MDSAKNEENCDLLINSINFCQQYKKSLVSSSNLSSNIFINDLLSINKARNTEQLQYWTKSLENVDLSNVKQWRTSLSKIDPVELLEKSLPTCSSCNVTEYSDLIQFQSNDCKCDLGIHEAQRETYSDGGYRRAVAKLGRTVSYEDSSQEDKNRQLFRPKFGRAKQNKNSNQISSSGTFSEGDSENWKNTEDEDKIHKSNVAKITFKTAKEQLLASNPAARRVLGTSRKAQAKFVSPMLGAQMDRQEPMEAEVSDERLKHIDPKMIELIESEIIDRGKPIGWDDIAGLQLAKSVIQEAVVWPLLRPDIFTGLRRPPKGILLFGPPGTGKTLIGKCIASQCKATFFSISASSLTSKWLGDGEKMVRALFTVAAAHQPAVIFIDEIDSLLTHRSESEHEATRRIKTEFLVQFDGAATGDEERVLVVGATNRPQELDEAARRRLVKRLYVPLPDLPARNQIITNLLVTESHSLSASQALEVASLSEGYSGADMAALCSEAAMGPLRDIPAHEIHTIQTSKVRPVCLQDFINALQRVRPSVSQDDLGQYVKWNSTYGQGF